MNQGVTASSVKIGVMALATAASLGLGVFRTFHALQIGAPPQRHAPIPPAPRDDRSADVATGATAPDGTADTRAVNSPAVLPGVNEIDPFIPLPPAAPKVAVAPVERPEGPGPGVSPGAGSPPPVLPGVAPETQAGRKLPRDRDPAPAPEVPTPPELIGTLLGQRVSAVFQIEGAARAVPLGSTVAGWKVVSVEHGQVKLTGYGVDRTITLGAPSKPDSPGEASERGVEEIP